MRFLIFLLILIFTVPVLAQENEKLSWTEDRILTWEDFKASPKKHLPYKANTNSGLSFSWNATESSGGIKLNYEVGSNFYPNRSWVKEIEEVDYLLAHEQLHFDITELHARKLRKALQNYEPGGKIKKELDSIYSETEKQRRQMQMQFDKETNHSIYKEAEFKWRVFIKKELDKLSEFSS
ncbi:hypothetical protein APR41_04305 [Salegentibacter salinarum]|uniref:DUF922 domain-containing protein n=1 Tax=Salegentibacter salinarum TaxID=447422 RepID=A0A2N0TUF9_9FLAO|nr:DUF922 domain-containing protein [Salegentibacter salinarum]PKD18379.1 hypothetical protein APR41_04305 [Salegentibacter salinarum]SKB44828.1 protein of unknown function [Salegentibacter salinarum]